METTDSQRSKSKDRGAVMLSAETHAALMSFAEDHDHKVGKLADRLIREGLDRLNHPVSARPRAHATASA